MSILQWQEGLSQWRRLPIQTPKEESFSGQSVHEPVDESTAEFWIKGWSIGKGSWQIRRVLRQRCQGPLVVTIIVRALRILQGILAFAEEEVLPALLLLRHWQVQRDGVQVSVPASEAQGR